MFAGAHTHTHQYRQHTPLCSAHNNGFASQVSASSPLFIFDQNTANTNRHTQAHIHRGIRAHTHTHSVHNMSANILVIAVKIDLVHGINEIFANERCVSVCECVCAPKQARRQRASTATRTETVKNG